MKLAAHKEAASRAQEAWELYRECRICPRDCGVDRVAGEIGYCRINAEARCFREVLHFGEEAELNPSHQIYFSGCNLVCEFCTVLEWVEQPQVGLLVNAQDLRGRCGARRHGRQCVAPRVERPRDGRQPIRALRVAARRHVLEIAGILDDVDRGARVHRER